MSISSDDDTDSTKKSDSEYDSEHDSDVDMGMEDDVDTPDCIDIDGDVDMEWDGDNEAEKDKVEKDEEEEDEKEQEEEEEDEDEEEDENEDDGKQPRTIGQGETVNPSADNGDTVVDDQPNVLREHGQKMREHTPWTQPPASAIRPQTPEPRPQPQIPETHPLSGLEHLGLVTPQQPRPAVQTCREAEAAGNTTDVDVDQQLLSELVRGDSLPDVPLPDVPLPDVPLPDVPPPDVPLSDVPLSEVPLPDVPLSDVPLPNVPLPDVPLPNVPLPNVPLPNVPPPVARLDGWVGQEWTAHRVAEKAMFVGFRLGSGSCPVHFPCCNWFISGIDYYTYHKVFGSPRVNFIYGFCIGLILLVIFYS